MSAAREAKIVGMTRQTPPPSPLTHRSSRRLAAKLGVAQSTVAIVWKRHGLKPHRLERYNSSPDPDFETKAADIIGLYITPPMNAVVICVDEKMAMQALDRTDTVLPLRPGRAEAHGFKYVRHGTRSLSAALVVGTGRAQGKWRHAIRVPSSWTFSGPCAYGAARNGDPLRRRQPVGA